MSLLTAHRIVAARFLGNGKREVQCLCGDHFRGMVWTEVYSLYGRHVEKEELATQGVKLSGSPDGKHS